MPIALFLSSALEPDPQLAGARQHSLLHRYVEMIAQLEAQIDPNVRPKNYGCYVARSRPAGLRDKRRAEINLILQ
jgi:hypothetical protein